MKNFEPLATDRADRIDATLVLGVLLVDTVMLAVIEIMYVTLTAHGAPLPLSALLALITTPWLVRRAGELATGTRGAVLVLLAWTGVVAVLGLGGPGGDVLLPGTWSSILFLLAGLIPGGFGLGRVIRHRRDVNAAAGT